MKKHYPIETQINILTNNHGLVIDKSNIDEVVLALTNYGYHEIINGYQTAFMKQNKNDQIFDDGTRFEQIQQLFKADVIFRNLVRHSTELFELTFKAALSSSIAINYGVEQSQYLLKYHYRQGTVNKYGENDRDWIFKRIDRVLKNKKQAIILHHVNYGNVPPWILIKQLTFGEVKQLFVLINEVEVKESVVRLMLPQDFIDKHGIFISKQFLHDLIGLAHDFRNHAAHANRIYNYHPTKPNLGIKNFLKFEPQKNGENVQSANYNRSMYALITGLACLNNTEPGNVLSQGIIDNVHDLIAGNVKKEVIIFILQSMSRAT